MASTQLTSTSYKCGLADREWILFFTWDLVSATILAPPSTTPDKLLGNPRALLRWKVDNAKVQSEMLELSIAILCGFTNAPELRHKAKAADLFTVMSPLEAQNVDAWDRLVCKHESVVEGFLRSNRKWHARSVVRAYVNANWIYASKVCAEMVEEVLELLVHCYRKDENDPPAWLLAILYNKRMLHGDRIRQSLDLRPRRK